jgi:hypothetical protein
MDEITTVGIDLAKEVFAVCVLDARGAVLERKVLRRAAFERWAAALAPCIVAMEACGSAHHWGRTFAARGHTARLIAAEFVVAFRQGGKNDGNDALAIAIAARQPTMRFVVRPHVSLGHRGPLQGSGALRLCHTGTKGFAPTLSVLGFFEANTATRLNGSAPTLMNVCGTPAGTFATYGARTVNVSLPIWYWALPWSSMCASSVSCTWSPGPPPGWVSVMMNESVSKPYWSPVRR